MQVFKFIAMLTLTIAFSATSWAETTMPTEPTQKSSQRPSYEDEDVPVSRGKYITGGILGSAIGFGIGHAVQGRYGEKGWIFTVGEAAGFTMLLAALGDCKTTYDAYGNRTEVCGGSGGIGTLGLATLIGFHIWEVVDVWTGATPVDEDVKVFLIPDPKAPGLGLAYSF